jgi:hypothetical protein
MSRKKKIKSAIYLYEEQIRALKKLSVRLDEPVSKLIRQGVDAILKMHRK